MDGGLTGLDAVVLEVDADLVEAQHALLDGQVHPASQLGRAQRVPVLSELARRCGAEALGGQQQERLHRVVQQQHGGRRLRLR
jgi:2-iminoacetate synthase ThiH